MGKKAKRRSILVAGIAIFFWTGLLIHFVRTASRQEPEVILWSHDYFDPDPEVSAEIGEVHRRLREILPEVNFHETPFGDAVRKLEDSVHETSPDLEPVLFRMEEGVPLDTPINLKLKNVPASEALRYLSSLNQCRYEVRAGRVIGVGLLSSPNQQESVEGWFSISPDFFHGISTAKDQSAIREIFERVGISLSATDSVEYFPDRSLLRATTSRDNLELIHAYASSRIICYLPTWRDHLAEWWYQTRIKLRLAPAPLPATPATPLLAPDPFAGPSPTGIGSPPDPFEN